MSDVEITGVEDAFQAGKRLFAEGQVEAAHAKLVLACERTPLPLYRLHEEFVASRVSGSFADVEETKSLATKLTKDETASAFAQYVLGYVALEQKNTGTAKRHFENAFRLDRELRDAGRQARRLGGDSTPTPAIGFHPIPMAQVQANAKAKAKSPHARVFALVAVLGALLLGAVGYGVAVRSGVWAAYEEVH